MAAEPAKAAKLRGVVAMAFVADVAKSLEFYQQLGFAVGKTHADAGKLVWALLASADGRAQLMLARSARPMNPGAQDVLFYLYAENVEQYRKDLAAKGLPVSEMKYPFYSPRGEFRLDDPDGYTLMIAHAG